MGNNEVFPNVLPEFKDLILLFVSPALSGNLKTRSTVALINLIICDIYQVWEYPSNDTVILDHGMAMSYLFLTSKPINKK